MRCAGWMVGLLTSSCCVITLSGCTTLDEHQRLQAAHRNLNAEKEALAQELFDARSVTDSLRTRVGSLERELGTNGELLANLRQENELLDEMRKTCQGALEGIGAKQTLGAIAITGPALPQPLDTALKRFADEHPSAVVYDPGRGTVKWKADLLFALGSDIVKQSSMEALRGFTDIVNSPVASGFEVIIVGHTDNHPIVKPATKAKHPTNWHLSAHRAISVSNVLRTNGYSPERIGIMGCGEHRPVADNASESGSSQNRRVEIYLVPRGAIVAASANAGRQSGSEALGRIPATP